MTLFGFVFKFKKISCVDTSSIWKLFAATNADFGRIKHVSDVYYIQAQ